MSIAWNAFTPAAALIGGVIIGAAVALFVVLNGRIAGVSGILGGLARPQAGDISWRVAFVAGLIAAPLALLAALPEIRVDTSRSEEHTAELQSLRHLVCRLLLEKKK